MSIICNKVAPCHVRRVDLQLIFLLGMLVLLLLLAFVVNIALLSRSFAFQEVPAVKHCTPVYNTEFEVCLITSFQDSICTLLS